VTEEGESPKNSAQREIREEIGLAAGKLERIGGFYLAPGYSTEYMHVFLATELFPDPLQCDTDEIITVVKLSVKEALDLAETGQLQDSKSLVALFWAYPHLMKLGLV
jgi:ADP-ribose pyrophosphatase